MPLWKWTTNLNFDFLQMFMVLCQSSKSLKSHIVGPLPTNQNVFLAWCIETSRFGHDRGWTKSWCRIGRMENRSTETSFGSRKSKKIRDGKYKSAKRQFSTSGIDFSANYYGVFLIIVFWLWYKTKWILRMIFLVLDSLQNISTRNSPDEFNRFNF